MDNPQTKFAYLAGLIDGEGCIDFGTSIKKKRRYYYPRLRISMTDFSYLDHLKKLIADLGLPHYVETRSRKFANPKWHDAWCMSVIGVKRILKWSPIGNLLLNKKLEWSLLEKFIESRLKSNPNNGSNKFRDYTQEELNCVESVKKAKCLND